MSGPSTWPGFVTRFCPKDRSRPVRVVGLLLFLTGLTSCRDVLTTAPDSSSLSPAVEPRQSVQSDISQAAAVSGTALVPGESSNAWPLGGYTDWAPVALPTGPGPGPIYVHVRTDGMTRYTVRDDYKTARCYWLTGVCDGDMGSGSAEGAGLGGPGSELSVELRTNSQWGAPFARVKGGQMEWLARVQPGDRFESRRWGIRGHRSDSAQVVHAYDIDGSGLHLVATGVVPIAAVPDREEIAPGQSVTFRLHTFSPDVYNVTAYWYDREGLTWLDCRQSCTVTPRSTGYLYVSGNWGATAAGVATVSHATHVRVVVGGGCGGAQPGGPSLVCQEPGPKLEVICPSPVMRGEKALCTARRAPDSGPGELITTSWKFDEIVEREEDIGSHIWEGQVVRSGDVRVTATIGGTEVNGSAHIEVAPRTATWRPVAIFEADQLIPMNSDSRFSYILKSPPSTFRDLGQAGLFDSPTDSVPADEVVVTVDDFGPNHGLLYFPSNMAFKAFPLYMVNSDLQRGSSFWTGQANVAGTGFVGGRVACSQHLLPMVIAAVTRHELRHLDLYRQGFAAELRAASAKLEKQTAASPADAAVMLQSYEGAFRTAWSEGHRRSGVIDNPNHPDAVEFRENGQLCYLRDTFGHPL
jgi:hypothetical protein